MLSFLIPIIITVLLIVVDQITKLIVVNNLEFHQPVTAIKGLLNWTYTTNTGGGFSIMTGKTGILLVVTVIVMIAVVVLYCRGFFNHWTGKWAAVLIVSGGLGNMIDRIFNAGKVVDFIDISPVFNFPIFNFADCCVTVGAVLFCVYILFYHEFRDSKKAVDEVGDE